MCLITQRQSSAIVKTGLCPGAQQDNELLSPSFGEITDLRLYTSAPSPEPAALCSRHCATCSTGKRAAQQEDLLIPSTDPDSRN